MNSKIVSFAVAALLTSSDTTAQTLTEAIERTLHSNPNILATQQTLVAAQHLYQESRAGYRPSIDLMISRGQETSNNTTTRAENVSSLTLLRDENSLQLRQMLWDGMSTKRLVEQQKATVDAALARLVSSQETVSLRAVQVYLEMLRRTGVVELAQKNLDQHEKTLVKIQERFEGGVGTKVDVVQTLGRRAQSKSNLMLAQRDARNGAAQFLRVVGEEPRELQKPAEIEGLPATLETAIKLAEENNPNLVAAESDYEASVAAHKQAEASFRPRFDLELGVTNNEDIEGSRGPNEDRTAIVRMTYNLYHGGADRARLNELEAREFAAQETLRSIRRGVREDITLIWNELEDIRMRLEYLRAYVKSTEEVLAVYNDQLALGKRTLLDLLDVQNELLRARVGLLTGEYTEIFARYRVLAGVGGLLDALGMESAKSPPR